VNVGWGGNSARVGCIGRQPHGASPARAAGHARWQVHYGLVPSGHAMVQGLQWRQGDTLCKRG
jgi:hypothetical protein